MNNTEIRFAFHWGTIHKVLLILAVVAIGPALAGCKKRPVVYSAPDPAPKSDWERRMEADEEERRYREMDERNAEAEADRARRHAQFLENVAAAQAASPPKASAPSYPVSPPSSPSLPSPPPSVEPRTVVDPPPSKADDAVVSPQPRFGITKEAR